MKRLLKGATTGLATILTLGGPTTWSLAQPISKTASSRQAQAAFPVTRQTQPLQTSHEFLTMDVPVGAEPILMLPFDIASATYTDGNIAVPRPIAANRILIAGKKAGKTEIILRVKGDPERLFTIKVSVEEIPAPANPPVRTSNSGPFITGPVPYKKPFPVKEVAEMVTDTRTPKTIEIATGSSRILSFDANIIEVFSSSGGQIKAFALTPRSVTIAGKAPGQARLVVRTRRSPSDQTGQTEHFKINVVKATPNSPGAWKQREKELEAEIEKRDERIRELERQLAEKLG